MIDSVKTQYQQPGTVPDDPNVGTQGNVDNTQGTPPQTGSGNIDVTGIKVSYQDDKVVVELQLDTHGIDDVPGADPGAHADTASIFMQFDPQQGLDLIGLMGQVTDQLRHALAGIKSSVHATEMAVRQEQFDTQNEAADKEKELGETGFAFSIAEGVSQMAIGSVTTGVAMSGGTSQAGMMQAQAKSQAIGQIGGGLTAPIGGTEKLMEGNIKAEQQRKQASAQFLGSMLQDLNPQSLHDAIKEVQQYYSQAADKVGQGYSILAGNVKMS